MTLHLLVAISVVIAAEPERSVAEWVKDLDDPQSLVREEAIEMLIRAKAKDAVPKLTKLLDDPLPSVRRRAAIALWKIDGQTKPALASLTAAVRDPNASQRREALLMLRDLAPPDEEYVPLLISLLEDRDTVLASQARGLLRFKSDKAVPAVLAALPKADAETRLRLLTFFTTLPTSERAKVEPALRELLAKSDDRSRVAIIRLLQRPRGEIGEFASVLAEVAGGKDPVAKTEAFQLALAARPPRKELAPVYKQALRDADGYNRGRAVEALYELDPATLKETMPVLVDMMKGGSTARSAALSVLQRLGPEAKAALPAITEMIANADEHSGHEVAMFVPSLTRLGPDAVPFLVKLLKHPNVMIRNNAGAAVWQAGAAALPHLLPLLKDENLEARRAAFHAVSLLGAAGQKALPSLVEGLRDNDATIRRHALTTLLNLGPASQDAVGPLLDALKDATQPDGYRAQAAQILGRIGPPAKAAGPELRKLLKSNLAQTRLRSAEALWLIEGDRKEALPVLLHDLKNNREALNIQPNPILEFAVSAGVPAAEIVDILKAWSDKDRTMRRNIITLISRYYPDAKEAIPLLTTLLMEEDQFTRRIAATALAHHGPAGKAAAPVIGEVLRTQNYLDPPLVTAVSDLGPAAAELLPTLLDIWKRPQSATVKPKLAEIIITLDRDKGKEQLEFLRQQLKTRALTSPRVTALAALARVEPKNAELVAALDEFASKSNRSTAAAALTALASMKADAKEALPTIRVQIKNTDPLIRLRAAEALRRVTGNPDEALPVLTALLAERTDGRSFAEGGLLSRWTIATHAAQALGEIGAPAKSAVPELRKCLSEPDDTLRRATTEALKRIER